MKFPRRRLLLNMAAIGVASAVHAASSRRISIPGLSMRDPGQLGMTTERLLEADTLVAEAVSRGGVPGAVLLIARRGSIVLRKAYGFAGMRPETRPMALDMVFDLASLTKPVATATSALILLEQGRIKLDSPVTHYLAAFALAGGAKADITIRHLFTHAGGLPAGGAYAGRTITTPEIVREIANRQQMGPPGQQFLYSDLSFITLGAVVEAVSGQSLSDFARDNIFTPLGMNDTGFRPDARLAARIAATTSGDDTRETRGIVHDPTAKALGGVGGSAGLFSTADDLARFCQMMLNQGQYEGVRILRPETVLMATTKQSPYSGNVRGLGWDIDSSYSIRGTLPLGSFGHTGFTGTSVWIDPITQTFVLLLTNAVHGKPTPRSINPLRRGIASAVAASITDLPSLPPSAGPGTVGANK
ncbi:MAG: serine hydrolase domain-containing protein [Armatimonadota bacterium]